MRALLLLLAVLLGPAPAVADGAWTGSAFINDQTKFLSASDMNAFRDWIIQQAPTAAFTAPGSTAARTAVARSAERRSIRDWSAACDGTTDDSAAMAAAATALRDTGVAIYIPGNCRVLMGPAAQVWLRGVSVVGDGARDMGPTYGQHGSTLLFTDTTRSPFVVSDAWGFEGLTFYWPNQVPATTPIVYPPVVAIHSSSEQIKAWRFTNNQVINAYDLINITGAVVTGHFHFERNAIFVLRYGLLMDNNGGESWIVDNQFSPFAWENAAFGASAGLIKYAAANAEPIRIVGNATSTSASTKSTDGLRVINNYFFMTRHGTHVSGGQMTISSYVANSYDLVRQAFVVDGYGSAQAVQHVGGVIATGNYWNAADTGCAISLSGIDSGVSLTGVDATTTAGGFLCVTDPGNVHVTVTGGSVWNVGSGTTAAGPFRAIDFNAPNGSLTVSGVPIRNTRTSNVIDAIRVTAARSASISGNNFDGWSASINADSGVAAGTYAGNTTVNTASGSTASMVGAGLPNLLVGVNRADVEPLGVSMVGAVSGGTPSLSFSGSDASVSGALRFKGAGFFSAVNGLGVLFASVPNGTAAQVAYPQFVTAPAGAAVRSTVQGAAANIDHQVDAKGTGALLLLSVPLCSAAPAGALCSASGSGSAVSVK